jgi:ribosomal protein S18 acetylase RimI-like enzyme
MSGCATWTGAAAGGSRDADAGRRRERSATPHRRHAPVTGRPGRIRIRRVAAGEADTLRAVRLRALADAPLAFGSNLAREAAYPPERWVAWARESADGRRQATFLAVDAEGDAAVGLAFTVLDAEDDALAHLFSMWVAPEARRSGAGGALVDAVVRWATAAGAERVRTAVTVGNDGAARLYERGGFRDIGVREPLGHSDAEVIVLERPLGR